MTHQILPVLELRSLLQQTLSVGCLDHIWIGVFVHDLLGWHVVPVDVELGHSRFFCQDVSRQAVDVWMLWRVLDHLLVVVLHVDVVADTQELLAVLVGAGEQDCGDTNDVGLGELRGIRRFSL